MNEFVVSLLFGAVILVVFAWDQFKRPSYEASKELTRLIEFLAPSDLRNRRVYARAYAAYASILLLIYVVVCVFATVPVLGALGLAGGENLATAQSPIVPLSIALAMVGLAPSLPILQRFEEKIRFAAHHLSGIPARLLHGCRILQARPLGLPETDTRTGTGLLIPDQDWKRLRHYRRTSKPILADPADFAEDMAKIVAYRAWFLKHRLNASPRLPRPGILRHETDLAARIEGLILALDLLSGFGREAGADPAGQPRDTWEKYAAEADLLCADVCALVMLHVEHGLVATQPGNAWTDAAADEDETRRAAECLVRFLGGADRWADEGALVGIVWMRATVTALVVAFAWGTLLGNLENPQHFFPLASGFTFALSAFLIYSLAVFVALSLHERAVRRNRWPSMVTTDWTRWIGPVFWVFLGAGLASVICVTALNLYWSIVAVGFDRVLAKFWAGLASAVIYEGPRAMLGPILAVGLVASVDAWRVEDGSGRRRLWVMAITATAMAVWAAAARGFATQYNAYVIGQEIPSLLTLLGRDNLMLLAGVRAAAVGLAVLAVCQRTLARGLSDLPAPRAEPGAPPAPARP